MRWAQALASRALILLLCLEQASGRTRPVDPGLLREYYHAEPGLKTLVQRFEAIWVKTTEGCALKSSTVATPSTQVQHLCVTGDLLVPRSRPVPFAQFTRPEPVPVAPNGYYRTYPWLTGLGFTGLADQVQDSLNLAFSPPKKVRLHDITNRSLVHWPLVYGRNQLYQLQQTLRHIDVFIFIIAHNQDASYLPPWLVESPKVLRIFCVNSKYRGQHPKVVPLPLGIRAYGVKYAKQINAVRAQHFAPSADPPIHFRLGLSSVGKFNQKAIIRMQALAALRKNGYSIGREAVAVVNSSEYYHEMAHHKFVLSPPGIGNDAFRTWEALLMGRVPLVEPVLPRSLYARLPVILVDHWDNVTPAFLDRNWQALARRSYALDKLYMPYWVRRILYECLITR